VEVVVAVTVSRIIDADGIVVVVDGDDNAASKIGPPLA